MSHLYEVLSAWNLSFGCSFVKSLLKRPFMNSKPGPRGRFLARDRSQSKTRGRVKWLRSPVKPRSETESGTVGGQAERARLERTSARTERERPRCGGSI